MIKYVSTLAVITPLLFTAGCVSIIKAYDGPEKPLHEIALIKCERGTLEILRVDGNDKYSAKPGSCEIRALPGRHELQICFLEEAQFGTVVSRRSCGTPASVTLDARAGRVYRLGYDLDAKRWRPWIKDITGQ